MKTYKFAEWDNFPVDQEIFKELQNYYTSGFQALFESLKPTEPMLIGGCNIVSGSIYSGGIVTDGIAYHPTHGLMLVKGGPFGDDDTIAIHNITNDLIFEGNINHPAEMYKYLQSDSPNGGDGAFPKMLKNKWHNHLGAMGTAAFLEDVQNLFGYTIVGGWVEVVNNSDAQLYWRYNAVTKIVEVRGYGLAPNSSSAGDYFKLTSTGFALSGTPLTLVDYKPLFTQRTMGSFISGEGNSTSGIHYERSGNKIDGVMVWLDPQGRFKIDNVWVSSVPAGTTPKIYFNFLYSV